MQGRTFVVADLIGQAGLARRHQLSILVWSCALMVIEGYDMQVVGYAAPAIIKDLGLTRAAFGTVFSLSLFGYMAGAVLLGSLSDRIGRKRVVLAGVALFGTLTLAVAFVSDLYWIVALRFLAGIGLGAAVPATIALNAEYAPPERRATRISTIFVGYTLGGAASGLIAAQLLPLAGWPSLFVVGGVLPLAVGAMFWLAVPESALFLATWRGRRGQLLRVLQRLRPDLSLTAEDRFQVTEQRSEGVPVRELFVSGRYRLTLALWTSIVLNFVTLHFLTSWLPTVINDSGLSQSLAAVVGATFLAGGALGALTIGKLLDKRGALAVSGMLVLSAPFVAGLGSAGVNVLVLVAGAFLAGLTVQAGQIGLNSIAGTFYPTAARSTGAGWALGVGRIGSIAGPALGGLLLTMHLNTQLLFVIAAIPGLCAGLVCIFLARSTRHQARRPSALALNEALNEGRKEVAT